MNIGTVVEGPSDRLVLKAVLDKLLPGEHRYFALQPSLTFGEMGTGWKGVRRWCQQTWQLEDSSLEKILSSGVAVPLDLLVIHLDADIAGEYDLQAHSSHEPAILDVQQPCPPVQETVNKLRQVIARWLDHNPDTLPEQILLAIPAQHTESWLFAALFPDDDLCQREDYECLKSRNDDPAFRLTLKRYGKHLSRRGKKISKPVRNYQKVASQVALKWDTVCKICSQARAFAEDLPA